MATKSKNARSTLCFDCENYLNCDKFTHSVLVPGCVTRFKITVILANAPFCISAQIINCKNYKKEQKRND